MSPHVGLLARHLNTLHTSLAGDTLEMALASRKPAPGLSITLIVELQYASGDCQALLAKDNCICTLSRKGNCWDTAVAESFFATCEWELIEGSGWHTHEEARW